VNFSQANNIVPAVSMMPKRSDQKRICLES